MTRFQGVKSHKRYTVNVEPSEEKARTCTTCGGPVHRSWRTGILHSRCFTCRYLVMIYGPSIRVTREPR